MRKLINREKIVTLLKKHGGNCHAVARIYGCHENSVIAIARINKGECVRCKAPVALGRKECKKCLNENRERIKKIRKDRKRRGVCIACGKPRMDGSTHYCAKHRRAAGERNKAYYRRKGIQTPQQRRRRTAEMYGPAGWEAWTRDDASCQICKTRYGELAVHLHHIDQNRRNNTVGNLVCLCFDCHQTIHRLLASKDRKGLIAWFSKTYPNHPLF